MARNLLASVVRFVTGVRIHELEDWTGEACVFFANHSSHLDALVIWAALPAEVRDLVSPVAARDYWEKGRVRRWISTKVFHAILLERSGRPRSREHPMQPLVDAIRQGRSIIVFPEGTRSEDGRLNSFRAGLHYLREKFPAVPMIPVSLENLNRILPKGQRLPVPLIGRIRVHPRMSFMEDENRCEFLARARSLVLSGLSWECGRSEHSTPLENK
ncbi:MAG: 1-acyl-sn-glycerol-3-phosphate acyltransferase [Verrucomicrobiales bacterium]|jgi:1-acyl-sn-glycerol-3-phosphate acyltransferase|nr:1-acyl-sn-glycerol-3-phosphate acyltransferase [Verrucomicrobiales bacterium]MBP9222301.1 1-acyl-sn-glycerol-3-phosphate acyltransferase [Verrucomicrobiales bacterium]HQZ27921.1 lysophospholipid acyltransferase family protein [Verrucomicrobiales bacterium]